MTDHSTNLARNGLTQKRVSKQPECANAPEKGANQSRKCKTNEYNNGRTECSNMVPHKQKDTTGVENIGQTSEQLPSPGAAVNTKSFWSRVATSSVACKATRPKT